MLSANGVTDSEGRFLDGDNDGQPGGNWNRDVAVTILGDLNVDFRVDFTDFLVLSANFGKPASASNGDLTGDGRVDFADFLLLSKNFGKP